MRLKHVLFCHVLVDNQLRQLQGTLFQANKNGSLQEHFQSIVKFSSKTPSSGLVHLKDGEDDPFLLSAEKTPRQRAGWGGVFVTAGGNTPHVIRST